MSLLDEVRLREDNIVIELFDDDDISSGGIFIGLKWDEGYRRGRILKTGPGRTTKAGLTLPLSVGVGEVVVIEPLAGKYFDPAKEEQYRLITEDEILFVLD